MSSVRLKGRRIFLTGAASGIGKATAELFQSEGAQLALLDQNENALKEVSEALDATPIAYNLADLTGIDAVVEQAAQALGGLDGVVNCAGMGVPTSIEDTDLDLLSLHFAVNVMAPYLICRAALPHLREANGSTIVNIASRMALLPNAPNNTAYAATKGGLLSFTKALAAEVTPHVRANVICPGVTNTPMGSGLYDGYADPSDAPWVQQVALRRIADPSEIANAVLFLTSAESSYITGTAMAVDGGRSFH